MESTRGGASDSSGTKNVLLRLAARPQGVTYCSKLPEAAASKLVRQNPPGTLSSPVVLKPEAEGHHEGVSAAATTGVFDAGFLCGMAGPPAVASSRTTRRRYFRDATTTGLQGSFRFQFFVCFAPRALACLWLDCGT